MIPLITHPEYSFDFPTKHRFPMEKFKRLHQFLQVQGLATAKNTFRPGKARRDVLELAHCPHYLDRFINNQQTPKELRQMALPWSEGLAKRSLISPNGTLLTASLALEYGIACHLAGGTHHAHYDYAAGYCVINDLAVASLALLHNPRSRSRINQSVLIFDCDVHQGDGTARILQSEPRAFTCSIHCESNFPAEKARSDLDIELPAGMRDDQYLSTVMKTLSVAFERSKPGLVFYDAGVDVYEHDPLGLLNISLDGLRERESLVLEFCRRKGVPVATVIGGGYDKDRDALTRRHAMAVEAAFRHYGH